MGNNGLGERVIRAGLNGGGKLKYIEGLVKDQNVRDRRLAERQRASLVKDNVGELGGLLKRSAALYQNTALRRDASSNLPATLV